MVRGWMLGAGLAAALALAGAALAEPPAEIAAKIRASGQAMDASVMAMYAPLHPKPPYTGVTVVRDLAYGTDPLQKLDVFAPPNAAGATRPVVIFVHGGGFVRGDKHGNADSPFEDNHPLWAARNDMVGVNINYRLAPKDPYPAGAADLASAIAWARANAARYGGDPGKIYIWGHSAGANHVADYVAHTELHIGPRGGVAGAIIQSATYADSRVEGVTPLRAGSAGNGLPATAVPVTAPPTNAYYGADQSLWSAEASLARMEKSQIPMLLAYAEFDPPGFQSYMRRLNDTLVKAGKPPRALLLLKGHNHFSEGAMIGTSDDSLTGPMLSFIRSGR